MVEDLDKIIKIQFIISMFLFSSVKFVKFLYLGITGELYTIINILFNRATIHFVWEFQ